MTGAGQTAWLTGEGLACVRGDRLLFERLNLRLAAGDAALVTGPNGAGKSSLLRLLAGLLIPAAGTLRREGGIALAAEAAALQSGRTLAQALGFWAGLDRPSAFLPRQGEVAPKGSEGAAARHSWLADAQLGSAPPPAPSVSFAATSPWRGRNEGLRHALDAMALAPLAQVPVRMLSTGQRKRATIARVIAGGTPIWLLDEPGNGLDADNLTRLAAAIAAHRAGGGIVVAATHQPLGLTDAIEVRL